MKPKDFVDAVCDLEFEDTFNPYADRCAIHDAAGAPEARTKMLRDTLSLRK
jgi:hypothetical protein